VHEAIKLEIEYGRQSKHRSISAAVLSDPLHELRVVSNVLAVEAKMHKVKYKQKAHSHNCQDYVVKG
jgi:hypothetical protein